jgi:tetratricopeptide (TPR) repeat protein
MNQLKFYLLLAIAVFVCPPMTLRASEADFTFESANKLYEQGRYADAAAAYDRLLGAGTVSSAVYFNRGNAFFKLGQVGRAIASYRRAEGLSPRDPDVRANLQIARTKARGGAPYQTDRWRNWLGRLTLNEWAVLTALAVWLLFVLLALGQWRAELRRPLRSYTVAAGLAAVVLVTCFAIKLNEDYLTPSAIVISGEADVRNGPLDESPGIYKVRDGAELNVLDQKADWLQVIDSAQRAGWLRKDQVLLLEPAAPAKAKS